MIRKEMINKALHLALFLSGLSFATINSALAQEEILSYHSDIEIHADASMTVTEKITVRSEGNRIQRGIYRDFPTQYEDRLGNAIRVNFQPMSVTRGGNNEPWYIDSRANGVRVYIGDADVLLANGIHSYELRYQTNRQLGYFDDHDELYWNVTGNGWDFRILQASASIQLPEQVGISDLAVEGYTGPFGASGQAYTTELSQGGANITGTGTLNPREGLTVVLSWPKGLVYEPNSGDRALYLLNDNSGLLIALLALILSAIYLQLVWNKVGRDPKAGPVFPHYEPPKGYSPASARYINTMGYDKKVFTAAIINLAVKGYLSITQEDKTYTLDKKDSTKELAPGEQALLARLFKDKSSIELQNENHYELSKTMLAHRQALRKDYLSIYFAKNYMYLAPSMIGSMLALVIIGLLNLATVIVAIPVVLNFILHAVFIKLMAAPSSRGRKLMDKLDGFKLYLEVAEKDDLNLSHPPDMTPELFEKYLPFAIALDVEHDWAEQFTKVFLSIKAQTGNSYHPVWYYGAFSSLEMGSFADNIGSDLSSTISSASTAPGSGSGAGGGGFSGGGCGGGGGGGW